MIVRAAIPVATGVLRLHAEKGRQWSPIEHLILHVLCRGGSSIAEMAQLCALPVRVVIEVVIRLMRAGWAEMKQERDKTLFQATPAGARIVESDRLPSVTKPIRRRAGFAYDLITGAVFRSRDLTLYSKSRLAELRKDTEIVVLPSSSTRPLPIQEILNRLLDEDEEFKAIEPTGEKLLEKYALVTSLRGAIDGLPPYTPQDLIEKVQSACGKRDERKGAASPVTQKAVPTESSRFKWLEATFGHDDLVIGGDAHERLLQSAIRNCQSRLVIHSTFINPAAFDGIAPLLHDAARRGVHVDILFGLDLSGERAARASEMRAIVSRCMSNFDDPEVASQINFHPATTGSHAKVMLFDNGRGDMFAALGSCNWLNSDFGSFEVSALCKDPQLVSELVIAVADMDQTYPGHWTKFTKELALMASQLRKKESRRGTRARATLVFGADHNWFVRKARDEAKQRIVIASHRVSGKAQTQVVYPAKAAMADQPLEVVLYYGRVDKGGDAVVQAPFEERRILFRQILEPKMHAKVLCWDSDDVVITSQNWLSADPGEGNPMAEIGIYLSAKGLAKELIEQLHRILGK